METQQPDAMPADAIRALDRQFVMGTYGRQQPVFVRGLGARLWDAEGKEYLDFLSGISVCNVGHCHPHVSQAIAQQAQTLMHVSNLFHHPLQSRLAERLCRLCGMDKAFFCNSGAEANEAAIKIARKWGKAKRGEKCHEIVTFHGSFHGRTLATVTATAQPKYQAPFAPLPAGFHYVELDDAEGLDSAISERTCAVLIEPIQGESGVRPVPHEFLRAMRRLCDEREVLLVFDEVQCGLGRTGCFLACHGAGVRPDLVTLAKAIASGVPMGVCLARGEAASTLVPGDHGSTFGGQPLACAAALATLDVIENERLQENAEVVGVRFQQKLAELRRAMPERIAEVRGIGLMIGVELFRPEARAVLAAMLERGVILNAVGDHVLRFLPPLVVTEEQCESVVLQLGEALGAVTDLAPA